MNNNLSIPKMGESVSEATIIKWLKNEGDIIEKDEVYIEISTDKVDSEIPSPYKCRLTKIIKQNEDKVNILEPIAEVEWLEKVPLTSVNNTTNEPKSIELNEKATPILSMNKEWDKTSIKDLTPLVKKIFLKHGISQVEIQNIKGSGNKGRITKDNALSYINNRVHFIEDMPIHTSPQPKNSVVSINTDADDEKIVFDRMRGLIAKHMIQSKTLSAHCTSFSEVDVTQLVLWREENKNAFFQKHNSKLTYTHLFMLLIINVLKKYPKINAHQYNDGYILKSNINLGFATSLPNGNLIVPVVHKIQELDLPSLVSQVNDIASRAKNNKLELSEISNGTFTMSNTGIFGSLMGTPIINQPQVAIMSLGEILKTPAVIEKNGEDVIEVRKKMILSLSYDHRVVDGAYAASFLKEYKNNIEQFEKAIV